MRNPALDGARAKIGRAQHHLADLKSILDSEFDQKPDRSGASHQYYPERQELIVTLDKAAELNPKIGLVIGDCIHNARSALDHMVYQLAIANNAPPESARLTAFPIYLFPKEFDNFVDRRVKPFISAEALAEIKKLQPYYPGNAGVDDVIWCLSQLDIFDKHRLLIVAKHEFKVTSFLVIVPSGQELSHEISPGVWKDAVDGAEIIRFDLSEAIREPGKVHVKLRTASRIKIADTGLDCDAWPVGQVLSDCIQHVTNIVDGFGSLFFGE